MIEDSQNIISYARELEGVKTDLIRIGTSPLYPCKPLMDLWAEATSTQSKIKIISTVIDGNNIVQKIKALGKQEIDCLVGPFDSVKLRKYHNFLQIGTTNICFAVPRGHRLAKNETIKWKDLVGETIMVIKRGDSPIPDQMLNDLEENHPEVKVVEMHTFFDLDSYNECDEQGCLLSTLDCWANLHPNLMTIPFEEKYAIPFGIAYSKNPSKEVFGFIKTVESML